MFTVENSFIDFETGGEAVKILFDELGEDFLNSYKKVRDVVMEKRIGQDYLLSRKVTCSYPSFKEKYPNMDDDTFCLLTTDLLIRGEAMIFMLKKRTGVDVMKRYDEIKRSINKRKRIEQRNKNKMHLNDIDKKKSRVLQHRYLPIIKNGVTRIAMGLIYNIQYIYNMFIKRVVLNNVHY